MTGGPRRGLGLSALLIVINVALVAAVLAVVVVQAGRLLRQLGDAQALGRAGLAAATALRMVEGTEEDVVTAARLLAERPTLHQLAATGDTLGLRDFLERFRETSHLTSCAVLLPGGALVGVGRDAGWSSFVETADPANLANPTNPTNPANPADATDAVERADATRDRFLLPPQADGFFEAGATASLAARPEIRVLATRRLDEEYLATVGASVGARVALVGESGFGDDSRGDLRARALREGEIVRSRDVREDAYVAIIPLRPHAAGVLETTLPGAGVGAAMDELRRSLIVLALAVALAAALASVLLGHRLAAPLRALTGAAARIGRGDLETPVPRPRGTEIATLGATMEDMRRRLVDLTAELRRRRAEAETLLDGVLDGVFTVDRERRIRYLNPQAASLVGLSSADVIGRFCGDVLDPEPVGGVRPCESDCPILHARFRGTVRATERLRLRGHHTRTVVVTSARPGEAGEGPGTLQFQMMRDETEVEAARRLRDLVVANITHEFRTPLAAQRASIELLRDQLAAAASFGDGDPRSEIESLIASLELGTLRLTWLIDNLLESARLEAGRTAMRRQSVALDAVVEEASTLVGPLLAQRGQRLDTELPYPLPSVVGDSVRLTQVFVNLLANANKYAPTASTIRIGGEVGEGSLRIWVEDDGPGLPAEQRTMFFERFVRAPGDEPEEGGVGLGLWIVRSIVERHGGRVEAATAPETAGARIVVTLPWEGEAVR